MDYSFDRLFHTTKLVFNYIIQEYSTNICRIITKKLYYKSTEYARPNLFRNKSWIQNNWYSIIFNPNYNILLNLSLPIYHTLKGKTKS